MNDFEIVRDWIAEFPQPEAHEALDRIEAELARLREELRLAKDMNKADLPDYVRLAEGELDRLREENEAKSLLIKEGWTKYDAARKELGEKMDLAATHYGGVIEDLTRQRDTHLAALREIEAGTYPGTALTPGGPQYQTKKRMDRGMMRRIARAAIYEAEGEPTDAEVLRGLGYYSEVEEEK